MCFRSEFVVLDSGGYGWMGGESGKWEVDGCGWMDGWG